MAMNIFTTKIKSTIILKINSIQTSLVGIVNDKSTRMLDIKYYYMRYCIDAFIRQFIYVLAILQQSKMVFRYIIQWWIILQCVRNELCKWNEPKTKEGKFYSNNYYVTILYQNGRIRVCIFFSIWYVEVSYHP